MKLIPVINAPRNGKKYKALLVGGFDNILDEIRKKGIIDDYNVEIALHWKCVDKNHKSIPAPIEIILVLSDFNLNKHFLNELVLHALSAKVPLAAIGRGGKQQEKGLEALGLKSKAKEVVPINTPHAELAREAKEWDNGTRKVDKNWVDAPEAAPIQHPAPAKEVAKPLEAEKPVYITSGRYVTPSTSINKGQWTPEQHTILAVLAETEGMTATRLLTEFAREAGSYRTPAACIMQVRQIGIHSKHKDRIKAIARDLTHLAEAVQEKRVSVERAEAELVEGGRIKKGDEHVRDRKLLKPITAEYISTDLACVVLSGVMNRVNTFLKPLLDTETGLLMVKTVDVMTLKANLEKDLGGPLTSAPLAGGKGIPKEDTIKRILEKLKEFPEGAMISEIRGFGNIGTRDNLPALLQEMVKNKQLEEIEWEGSRAMHYALFGAAARLDAEEARHKEELAKKQADEAKKKADEAAHVERLAREEEKRRTALAAEAAKPVPQQSLSHREALKVLLKDPEKSRELRAVLDEHLNDSIDHWKREGLITAGQAEELKKNVKAKTASIEVDLEVHSNHDLLHSKGLSADTYFPRIVKR